MLTKLLNKKVFCEIASMSGSGMFSMTHVLGVLIAVEEKFIEIILEKADFASNRLNVLKKNNSKNIFIPIERINFIIEV